MVLRILLLLAILSFRAEICHAQPVLAKLKFEEAERAFQSREYDKTLTLLVEVERMINGTSPKTMHLRILATDKKGISDFATLTNLRKDCADFLKKYESIQDVAVLLRDVYEVQKGLARYPTNESGFYLLETPAKQLLDKVQLCPVRLGMNVSDLPQAILSSMDYMYDLENSKLVFWGSRASTEDSLGIRYLHIDNNGLLVEYEYHIAIGRQSDLPELLEYYNRLELQVLAALKKGNPFEDKSMPGQPLLVNKDYRVTMQESYWPGTRFAPKRLNVIPNKERTVEDYLGGFGSLTIGLFVNDFMHRDTLGTAQSTVYLVEKRSLQY